MSEIVHNFADSLRLSKEHEDNPFWLTTYRKAFPTLCAAVSVRNDGWAQRGGVDRVLTLACGRRITIDEKVRHKNYGDILLERWSDFDRRKDGWLVAPLLCDYIAYAIVPTSTCYLLPTLELQRAWRLHGQVWAENAKAKRDGFSIHRANNSSWVTINIAVPIQVLFQAITDAMVVAWGADA